ncbi:hypothetical protein O181_059252 [Austropuccinia psidii MF-1]|uniref:Uncharacterized protein n=1 Tax=Austropuccinia psidii MF-1 TaxID=1389203 RepID=A0A9Q3HX90_9BASI|nr:hypothetical protein [Austropuccinia psidii MF-1]
MLHVEAEGRRRTATYRGKSRKGVKRPTLLESRDSKSTISASNNFNPRIYFAPSTYRNQLCFKQDLLPRLGNHYGFVNSMASDTKPMSCHTQPDRRQGLETSKVSQASKEND